MLPRPFLDTCPYDVIRNIIMYLTPLDLCVTRSVNQTFKSVVDVVTHYLIESLMKQYPYLIGKGNEWIDEPQRLLHELTRERMFIVGGGSTEAGLDSYKLIDELCGLSSWKACSPMSSSRGTFKTEAISFQGKLVVCSGDTASAAGTLEGYCPLKDSWESLPSLPLPLALAASAACPARLFITGGIDQENGGCSNALYQLNSLSGPWTALAPMPQARFAHASAVIGQSLWIVGGQCPERPNSADTQPTCNTIVYNLTTNTWSNGPMMQRRRIWTRLLVIDGCLYAVGGDVDSTGFALVPSIEKLNVASGEERWEQPIDFTQQRRVFAATSLGGDVLVLGGRGDCYDFRLDCEIFRTKSAEWGNLSSAAVAMETASFVESQEDRSDSECRSGAFIPRAAFVGGTAVSVQQCPLKWQ